MRLTPSGGQSLRLHLERGCRKKAISRFAVRQERFDVVEQRFVAAAGLADVSEAVGRGAVEGLLPDARDLCVAIHCRGDDAGCADSNASSPVAAYRTRRGSCHLLTEWEPTAVSRTMSRSPPRTAAR